VSYPCVPTLFTVDRRPHSWKLRENNKNVLNLILNMHNENIAQIINTLKNTSLKVYLRMKLRGWRVVFKKGEMRRIFESMKKEVSVF
jgi:hypothetical protein